PRRMRAPHRGTCGTNAVKSDDVFTEFRQARQPVARLARSLRFADDPRFTRILDPYAAAMPTTPELKLFNTLTRAKETFAPLQPGRVGIYTCGPTVYHSAHIGNLRSYVFPDVLKKTLRLLGYQVNHVINITDVGHLTSNEDTGEDKMERAARSEGRSAWDIAKAYEAEFIGDLMRMNIAMPDHWPHATAHIPEQIEMIQMLEAKGYTYRTGDGIYFDTARFPDYGKLARLKVEGLQEGSRVEMGDKRHKTDFALWKFSAAGEKRQMEWDSPWGRGFPGWHIECSAMSRRYLGDTFDIHSGGTDHIPVHHTNEIAQSECATGHPFVRYWLHGEYLVVADEKAGPNEVRRMGKSEGNLLTLQTLVDAGYDPMAYRYLCLNSHYRSYLNFSEGALKAADTALMGLRKLLKDLGVPQPAASAQPQSPVQAQILADLCDDLNAPKALGTLWSALRDDSLSAPDKAAAASFAEQVLSVGLFDFARLNATVEIPATVKSLAEQRWAARQSKNFAESDRLRDELARQGYVMRDRKDGYDLVRAG
ncbi:MAG TPA: cysteine--tRNA ligase, partial [bacterium]